MKFKKAHNILTAAIYDLVTNDKYYLNGDLGIKPDGTLIDGTHDGDYTYFCNSLADIMSTKSVNCSTVENGNVPAWGTGGDKANPARLDFINPNDSDWVLARKQEMDDACKQVVASDSEYNVVDKEIITTDNAVFYQASPAHTFGRSWVPANTDYDLLSDEEKAQYDDMIKYYSAQNLRLFGCINENNLYCYGNQNFDRMYKVFCIDVDGIPDEVTKDDCVNECPFSYGIRSDGKIIPGARAEEWIKKEVRNND